MRRSLDNNGLCDTTLLPLFAHFHKTMFRNLYDPPKAIRNQRDFRFYPGIEPAGVKGVTPKLLDFISGRVMELAMSIQESPHHEGGGHF